MFFGSLDARSQTCQIVCTLVEVSMVEVVLVLEQDFWHGNDEIDCYSMFATTRRLERVAASRVDACRAFVRQLV